MNEERRVIIPIMQAGAPPKTQEDRRRGGSGLTALPPLTLYIHVPWCVKKCPYCDFNSHEAPAELPEKEYLDALTADLEQVLPLIWGRQVHAVFLGGGTPSMLTEATLDAMLAMVRSRLTLWANPEITIEANPGTVEASRFKGYAASGVTRISLGVQSLDDRQLAALGRVHDADQARRAIEMASKYFGRVNLDLMYGLPHQSTDQWRDALREIMAWRTEHLSLYQLTIEPQTVFAKYPPQRPDDETVADMEDVIMQETAPGGWERYEVSAYAHKGAQCRHNLNYWRFGDYLGIGPGAHSKISSPDQILRQVRTRSPVQWMQNAIKFDGSHISESCAVSAQDLPFEFMLNALRLKDGVPADLFEAHTGLPLHTIAKPLQRAMDKGLLSGNPTRLVATELGWRHLTTLQALFLPE